MTAVLDGKRTWRGRSGRRYACVVIGIADPIPCPARFLVALAVDRLDSGLARLITARLFTAACAAAARSAWASWARAKRADEIHLHHLEAADSDPQAIVSDLEP